MSDHYDELSRLAALRDSGGLTEEEFAKRKAEILKAISGKKPEPIRQKVMTWNELAESDEVISALQENTHFYREKFKSIIERAECGSDLIDDKTSLTAIFGRPSWNWPAFLFFVFWGAYRAIDGWKFILGTYCAIVVASFFVPRLDNVGIVVSVIFAIYGNNLLLSGVAKRLSGVRGQSRSLDEFKPSWKRVAIAALAVFVTFGAAILISPDDETSDLAGTKQSESPDSESGSANTVAKTVDGQAIYVGPRPLVCHDADGYQVPPAADNQHCLGDPRYPNERAISSTE